MSEENGVENKENTDKDTAVRTAGETVSRKTVTAVRPERTDILRHEGGSQSSQQVQHSIPRLQHRHRRREDTLIFGMVSRQTMSLIMLVIVAVTGFIFGVREISVSIPIFCVIMVIEFAMGLLLGNSPSFAAIILCGALMVVGALSGMFIAVCIGNAVMLSTVLMVKGN